MSPEFGRYTLQAGEALRANDVQTAEKLASLALHEDATDQTARLILGGVCFRSDRYREAADHFRTAVQQDPQAAEATLYLAESLRRLDDVVEAGQDVFLDLAMDERVGRLQGSYGSDGLRAFELFYVEVRNADPADFPFALEFVHGGPSFFEFG